MATLPKWGHALGEPAEHRVENGVGAFFLVQRQPGRRKTNRHSFLEDFAMKRLFWWLNVLAIFLGVAGQGQGQPTYAFTTLDVPGSSFPDQEVVATGINASGQIVGYYTDAAYAGTHGFLVDQGNNTTLDVPGSIYTYAYGINDSGQIVGSYFDAAFNVHGFLLDQGSYTTLDVPGSTGRTVANGINASGQIVGSYEVLPESTAFCWIRAAIPRSTSSHPG
jgi:probable HAF family extracellular repeat protein